jgi:type I restriction enzyme R subunit
MPSFIKEDDIEQVALDLLREQGYRILHGPDISLGGDKEERTSWQDVVLMERLKAAVDKLNPHLPAEAKEQAIKKLLRQQPNQLQTNQTFHNYLAHGVEIEYSEKGRIKGDRAIILSPDAKKNEFVAINQFTIIEKSNRRPDIIIFINGLPLILIELKNPASATATIDTAYTQLETYKQEIPSIFTYNELLIIADGTDAKVGTITSPYEWFMPWKTIDGIVQKKTQPQLETMIKGMLNKTTIIDLIQNFVAFEESRTKTTKIIAGYHQYHATNKAIEKTYKAVGKSKKVGVVWHTQGSGKSFTMAFYTGKITRDPKLKNPSIVIITDRNDLDGQLFTTFSELKTLLPETPKQIKSQPELKTALKVASGGIFFTTIQKFGTKGDASFELLSDRDNILVLADEAHRTQYGFKGKIKKEAMRYGYAKYLRDALPNASFLGFTGTPIDLTDRSTRGIFGDYIDIYDMKQALDDKRVVPIFYDSKLIKLGKNEEFFKNLDEDLEDLNELNDSNMQWNAMAELAGTEQRLTTLAKTLIRHYELRQSVMHGKAMVVCMSRRICVDLHDTIKKLRPDWYHKDDKKGVMKVIMTGGATDDKSWQEHIRDKKRRKDLGNDFKDPNTDFSIAIVRDMWLTGFDAPSLNSIYIDKPIKQHNLMQAIARVNRVYKDKNGGIVVDFIGIAEELKKATMNYTKSGGAGKPFHQEQEAISLMLTKHDIVKKMLHGTNYQQYFSKPKERMRLLPTMIDHIIGQEKGKERFVKNTYLLMGAFALAAASPEAQEIRDDVTLFQAIANALKKTDTTGTSKGRLNTAIRQLVSKAISTQGVMDIYRELGIEKPDISILSDKFLHNFQTMEYKNLAFEALKKLLAEEIKLRFKNNKVQDKKFSEQLEEAIKRYQNRSIDSAQVILELIEIAKNVREAQKRGEKLGLSDDEVAFYDALTKNESAKDLLGDEILKQMAKEISNKIRGSVSIDWKYRQSVRAKIMVEVQRLLTKYGYPPDKQQMAIDLVMKQAETFSDEVVESSLSPWATGPTEMAVAEKKKEYK